MVVVMPLWVCVVARAQTPADQRGIFVYTEHFAQDQTEVTQSLTLSGVDGLTLLQDWGSFETGIGVYDWTELDQWMTTAILSGKKITLALRAGAATPCWLFQAPACGSGYKQPYAGAAALAFQVSARQGIGQAGCTAATIAAPWDQVFLTQWDSMLAAVGRAPQERGGLRSRHLSAAHRNQPEHR
jgi:hypothetical protein